MLKKIMAPVCVILCFAAINLFSVSVEENSTDTSKTIPDATTAPASVDDTKAEKKLELTIEELAQYNGKDGKPIYVAVDGIIYDLTDVKAWKNGKHKGQTAGKDLTKIIKKSSPHGTKVLKDKKVVGKLIIK